MAKSRKTIRKTVIEADDVANEETPLNNRFKVGENSESGAGVTKNELIVAIANVNN